MNRVEIFRAMNGIVNGIRHILMVVTLKIDNAGRIVVPKPIRDRLGLRAGADIEVTETADGIVLKPVADQPPMERVNGLWVHQGSASAGFDWDRFIDEERESHGRRIFGL